jgi:hypothetical protein
MKNSSENIGNRTRNLPACSSVPQPTASPRALGLDIKRDKSFCLWNKLRSHFSIIQLVEQCLNQLRHRVPPEKNSKNKKLPFVPSSIKILPYTLDKTQNRSDDTDSR